MTSINFYFQGLEQSAQHLQTTSALHRLLALGHAKRLNVNNANHSLQSLLCAHCGMTFSSDCPVAALTYLGDTGEQTESYWLLATPVHLTLQRDFFSLTEALTLSETDSQALLASLNAHFADDGYVFSTTSTQEWLLRAPANRELLTTPISQVMGRDTRPFMPQGADAAWAAQLTNEIQMLLFEHPINQAREARGELAVNSIWLSGAGVLPATTPAQTKPSVFADNIFVSGLAYQAQLPLFATPESMRQLLANINHQSTSETLIWIDLTQSNQDWFAETAQLLRQRKLKRIRLFLDYSGKLIELTLSHWDIWKFWHKTKPIDTYFSG